MRYPFTYVMVCVLVVFGGLPVAVILAARPQRADNPRDVSNKYDKLSHANNPGGPAPIRDLSGAWAGPTDPIPHSTAELPRNPAVPPMTPLGQKMFSLNKPEGPQAEFGKQVPVALSNDPLKTCDPLGFPRDVTFEDRGIQFVQTPAALWQMFQYQRIWREIWTDGRALPKDVGGRSADSLDPRYYGYSVGHWNDDYTLVVDSVGTDDRTWLDNAGHPHSADLHVAERYTRIDHNDIEVSVTIDDPKMYTKPFEITKYNLKWIPEQQFEEQLCVPSEIIEYDRLVGALAGDPAAARKSR